MKVAITLVLLVAAFAAATAWRAARNTALAEAAYPPQGQFVEVEGTRIHYVEQGTGPALVLIHGASGSTREFSFRMIDALSDRYRVIAFDRPAFGYSERARGASIADQARILSAAAREIGASRPLVMGQSYGGAVALAWALAHPDETAGLVLVSAASQPWTTGIGTYYEVLSSKPGLALMAPLLSAWVPDGVLERTTASIFEPNAAPEGYLDHIGARLSLRLPTLRENALQRRQLLDEITAQEPRYPTLAMPAEVIHGTSDPIVSAAIHSIPLASELPDANLTLLEGIGHMPHHIAMDRVIEAIDRAAGRAGLR